MGKESLDREERQIRFVARHYQEGRLNGGKAWKQFAAVHKIARAIPFRRYAHSVVCRYLVCNGKQKTGMGGYFYCSGTDEECLFTG